MMWTLNEFAGHSIRMRNSDGYLSATDMVKINKKEWSEYYRNKQAREYLEALEENLKIPSTQLIESITKNCKSRGTWIHPRVAIHLAMWISPKFSVKVTEWVMEWRAFSQENENKFIDMLNKLEPSHSVKREKEIQEKLQTELSAEIEVSTLAGKIDLLTNDTVIEIKEYSKWKHAVGQVLCYGLYHADKKKKIILFGSGTIDELIKDTCSKLEIEVEILE